jgi:hypothetical protein
MRCTLLLLSLLLLACRPQGQTWILAGQSNASGSSTLDAPIPLPTPEGWVGYARTGWGEVRLAIDPLGSRNEEKRSPWPFFAAARVLAWHPTPYLVQTAEGGSCLAYARAEDEPRWAEGGALYARMLERVAAARAARFPKPVAVLWHQGECEGSQVGVSRSAIAAAYRDALLELADRVGADLGVPIVAALIVPINSRYLGVRDGVLQAAALHPDGILVVSDAGW